MYPFFIFHFLFLGRSFVISSSREPRLFVLAAWRTAKNKDNENIIGSRNFVHVWEKITFHSTHSTWFSIRPNISNFIQFGKHSAWLFQLSYATIYNADNYIEQEDSRVPRDLIPIDLEALALEPRTRLQVALEDYFAVEIWGKNANHGFTPTYNNGIFG